MERVCKLVSVFFFVTIRGAFLEFQVASTSQLGLFHCVKRIVRLCLLEFFVEILPDKNIVYPLVEVPFIK